MHTGDEAIRRLTTDYYHRSFEQHGDTPKGVDWKDSASQHLRFRQLLKDLAIDSPFTVLDVGCGTGALVDFLAEQTPASFRYHGIDFVALMIARASDKYRKKSHVHFSVNGLSEISEKY